MKRMKKILKICFLSVLTLILVIVVVLLVFYKSIYQKTPLPPEITVFNLNFSPQPVNPVLLPVPKNLHWTGGNFTFPSVIHFQAAADDAGIIQKVISNRLNLKAEPGKSGSFTFIKNKTLEEQAYILSVQPNLVRIEYASSTGLYYAITTLKQIREQSSHELPCVQIQDHPDLKIRGALLDISRGKIPTLQTLYHMVDFLSDLKYNQLQLYIEGFSFAYPSFKNVWEKTETPLNPEEIKALDLYCKDRFIELVPNQNSLGHMDAWLARDEYKDLAECPKGYALMGLINMKTTLAPSNPKSLELVSKMSDDLLPNFSSDKFNVDLDEPFELGKNKDRPVNDPKEVAKIYLDYATRLNKYVESKGKKMMMWGDIVSKNPDLVNEIPKDITLLEWRYEAFQDFEKICKTYHSAGLHYMVCPGTSSWTSFTGRTNNMMANIQNAVQNGIKYGADGMLITDWGDSPHLQYLTVSYAGLAYGAALSWNNTPNSGDALSDYLSKLVFRDTTNKMGNIVLDLGRYVQFEEYPMPSGTMTGWAYRFGMMNKTMTDAIFKKVQTGIFGLLAPGEEGMKILKDGFDHPKIYNPNAIILFVDTLEKELIKTHLDIPDSTLVMDEYKNAIHMVKLGAMVKQYDNYYLQQSDSANKVLLMEMKSLCQFIIREHERLWMMRNKKSGLEKSMESIRNLQIQIDQQLELLEKNEFTRWLNRIGDELKTAVAVLYLRHG
jgi:hexosaminidase